MGIFFGAQKRTLLCLLCKTSLLPRNAHAQFSFLVSQPYTVVVEHIIICQSLIDTNEIGEEPNPDIEEIYSGLSLNGDSSKYYATAIDRALNLVQVIERVAEHPPGDARVVTGGSDGGAIRNEDYNGRAITITRPSGETQTQQTGLEAFE
jgi:hypothetical protein